MLWWAGALVVVAGISAAGFAFAVYTDPTSAPPGGQTGAPITKGSSDQAKIGGLGSGSYVVAPKVVGRLPQVDNHVLLGFRYDGDSPGLYFRGGRIKSGSTFASITYDYTGGALKFSADGGTSYPLTVGDYEFATEVPAGGGSVPGVIVAGALHAKQNVWIEGGVALGSTPLSDPRLAVKVAGVTSGNPAEPEKGYLKVDKHITAPGFCLGTARRADDGNCITEWPTGGGEALWEVRDEKLQPATGGRAVGVRAPNFQTDLMQITGPMIAGPIKSAIFSLTGDQLGIAGVPVAFSNGVCLGNMCIREWSEIAPNVTVEGGDSVWVKKEVEDREDIYYSGGRVGIGIQSPDYKLDVRGNAGISGGLVVGGAFRINAIAGASGKPLVIAPDGFVRPGEFPAGGGGNDPRWKDYPTGNIYFDTGKVGIGGTPDANALKVTGSVNVTGEYLVNGAPLALGGVSVWEEIGGGSAIRYSGGNVIVGSGSAPRALLDVRGGLTLDGDLTLAQFAGSGGDGKFLKVGTGGKIEAVVLPTGSPAPPGGGGEPEGEPETEIWSVSDGKAILNEAVAQGFGLAGGRFEVDENGNLTAGSLTDADNASFFVDPSSDSVSLSVVGSIQSSGAGLNSFYGPIQIGGGDRADLTLWSGSLVLQDGGIAAGHLFLSGGSSVLPGNVHIGSQEGGSILAASQGLSFMGETTFSGSHFGVNSGGISLASQGDITLAPASGLNVLGNITLVPEVEIQPGAPEVVVEVIDSDQYKNEGVVTLPFRDVFLIADFERFTSGTRGGGRALKSDASIEAELEEIRRGAVDFLDGTGYLTVYHPDWWHDLEMIIDASKRIRSALLEGIGCDDSDLSQNCRKKRYDVDKNMAKEAPSVVYDLYFTSDIPGGAGAVKVPSLVNKIGNIFGDEVWRQIYDEESHVVRLDDILVNGRTTYIMEQEVVNKIKVAPDTAQQNDVKVAVLPIRVVPKYVKFRRHTTLKEQVLAAEVPPEVRVTGGSITGNRALFSEVEIMQRLLVPGGQSGIEGYVIVGGGEKSGGFCSNTFGVLTPDCSCGGGSRKIDVSSQAALCVWPGS